MTDYSKNVKRSDENMNDADFLGEISNEDREIFKRVLSEVAELEIQNIEEKTKDIEIPEHSKRYKRRINRLFRECAGGSFLPFPEVDNLYERVRSKIVTRLKINEFLDRRRERHRKR